MDEAGLSEVTLSVVSTPDQRFATSTPAYSGIAGGRSPKLRLCMAPNRQRSVERRRCHPPAKENRMTRRQLRDVLMLIAIVCNAAALAIIAWKGLPW